MPANNAKNAKNANSKANTAKNTRKANNAKNAKPSVHSFLKSNSVESTTVNGVTTETEEHINVKNGTGTRNVETRRNGKVISSKHNTIEPPKISVVSLDSFFSNFFPSTAVHDNSKKNNN
jgi:DNA-binding helix-hairpin-helix protein with protein kinase domain